MKKVILFLVISFVSTVGLADLPDLDDMNIRDQLDTRAFIVGRDDSVGTLIYVIDRTTGMCFARLGGLSLIDCENLKKVPILKQYIETGSVETP